MSREDFPTPHKPVDLPKLKSEEFRTRTLRQRIKLENC